MYLITPLLLFQFYVFICTGRSLFTRFLFARFRFNATWKFTPVFEFTR